MSKPTSLEAIAGHQALHEREWIFETVGFYLLGLFVSAGALGLFGSGWLAKTQKSDKGLNIRYDRFIRLSQENQLELSYLGDCLPAALVGIEVERNFFSRNSILEILPPPRQVDDLPGSFRYWFDCAAAGQALQVIFRIKPLQSGAQSAHVAINGAALKLSQRVFP